MLDYEAITVSNLINFAVVSRNDEIKIRMWTDRGFEVTTDIEPYIFECDTESNYIFIKKPDLLMGIDKVKICGKKVENIRTGFGSYGMGGCGYLGFKIKDGCNFLWIVICQRNCENHIQLDGRPFTCSKEKVKDQNPWYFGFAKHPENSRKPFYNELCKYEISDYSYASDVFKFEVKDNSGFPHFIEVKLQNPEMICVIYDESDLMH